MDYCLRQVAFDEKTGTFDVDRLSEVPASTRNKLVTVKEIIHELETKVGKSVPVEDIIKAALEKDITEAETEETLS